MLRVYAAPAALQLSSSKRGWPPLPQGATPAYHVVGNHCLSVPRAALLSRLRLPASYYAAPLAPGWRLIVLDTTEMSGHSGYPPDSEQASAARMPQ